MTTTTIDELCLILKCKSYALEHLDEQTEKRIQAKINNLKGVMNYHKEQKRKSLLLKLLIHKHKLTNTSIRLLNKERV